MPGTTAGRTCLDLRCWQRVLILLTQLLQPHLFPLEICAEVRHMVWHVGCSGGQAGPQRRGWGCDPGPSPLSKALPRARPSAAFRPAGAGTRATILGCGVSPNPYLGSHSMPFQALRNHSTRQVPLDGTEHHAPSHTSRYRYPQSVTLNTMTSDGVLWGRVGPHGIVESGVPTRDKQPLHHCSRAKMRWVHDCDGPDKRATVWGWAGRGVNAKVLRRTRLSTRIGGIGRYPITTRAHIPRAHRAHILRVHNRQKRSLRPHNPRPAASQNTRQSSACLVRLPNVTRPAQPSDPVEWPVLRRD